ncbi:MAG TPA: alpha/beta fold hydrolase [Verrucomicrobiae bacterium]|jgi:cholesterol oxidase
MKRLSTSLDNIKPHYTVVVVGSGYGGAITASRLARAGQSVCLLERGKELQPGEYPDTPAEAIAEIQVDLPGEHVGPATGLYDFHVNEDMNVFVGCGLGGTSLVNANVSLLPEERVIQDAVWPAALRADADGLLARGFDLAREMLKPKPYPDAFPVLAKLGALEKSAQSFLANTPNATFYRPPINVNFDVDGPNHVGVQQKACVLCGDCVTGCNHSAKNTVLMNYLPDARNFGAEIFCQCAVRWVEREGDKWIVHFAPLGEGREKFGAPTLTVSADVVVLSAGTLGSNEILLRSRAKGLKVSDQLGRRFTGNGDVLAFGYNNDAPIDGIGFGAHDPAGREPVGPCITGIIDLRQQPVLQDGRVIEEGSVPGAVGPLLPVALSVAAKALGRDTDTGIADAIREKAREWDSLVRGVYHGATRNTQTYLVMSHDSDAGRLELVDDRVRVVWPGAGTQPGLDKINDNLTEATRATGGTFVKNPIWSRLLGHELITVHPLGGCVLADDAASGVVNERGQVFAGTQGTAAHEGLYVSDGSVVPRPLGVNPLLTISALAERCAALVAKDRGWQIDYSLPSSPPPAGPPTTIGVQFTETMRGFFSTKVSDGDYARGEQQGRTDNSPFEFTLTVTADDLDKLIRDETHPGRMVGTVTAPALSPAPLTVTDGEFALFTVDPDQINARKMGYRMKLTAEGGRTFFFAGFKQVHDDRGFDVWADTTTLYITVHDGETGAAPILGQGILHILPADFAKQMTTMRVLNAPNGAARLKALADFGTYFSGVLLDTYGGIAARDSVFDPTAPPRKKRPLRVEAPEVHFFNTDDGVTLKLTRYRGGDKGPVILAHGLGVSSLIFSIDTIETNLVEFLFSHGYDVWLLDFRASIDLPAAKTQFTGDDIALNDYPGAVAKVREITNAASVQMVVHCFGSTTFFMAMLAGLHGVRSVVASQIAAHTVGGLMTKLKTGLHVPELLDKLGIKSLNAYVDANADWQDKLFNAALKLYPVEFEERSRSPVDRRIMFMYGVLYEHDQLNTATFDALHEMFGIANIRAFEHIARIARAGHLVRANGDEVYMGHFDRLALPITFIHGAENETFLPKSTELTFDALREANDHDGRKQLYHRYLIPNYGHIDCIFGKNAVRDVYPLILRQLEATL